MRNVVKSGHLQHNLILEKIPRYEVKTTTFIGTNNVSFSSQTNSLNPAKEIEMDEFITYFVHDKHIKQLWFAKMHLRKILPYFVLYNFYKFSYHIYFPLNKVHWWIYQVKIFIVHLFATKWGPLMNLPGYFAMQWTQ